MVVSAKQIKAKQAAAVESGRTDLQQNVSPAPMLTQSLVGRAASASATKTVKTQAMAGNRPITSTPTERTLQQKIEAAAKLPGKVMNTQTGEVTTIEPSVEVAQPKQEMSPAVEATTISNLEKDNTKLQKELNAQKTIANGYRADVRTVREQLGQTQNQLNTNKEQYLSQLGDFRNKIETQLKSVQMEVGELDFSDKNLQTALNEARTNNATPLQINTILREQALKQRQELVNQVNQPAIKAPEIPQVGEVAKASDIALKGTTIVPTDKSTPVVTPALPETPEFPEIKLTNYLDSTSELSFDNLKSTFADIFVGKDMSEVSSAEMNTALLTQLTLKSADENYVNQLANFKTMEKRAKESYDSVKGNATAATKEIDRITSGEKVSATTIESLNVKIAKQMADIGNVSIEATKSALNAEYQYTYGQMLEQNSRVEGYMKAKLNAIGAQDSSAGLSLMNTVIDNAQQRLLLYQGKHSADMVQLEAEKAKLMLDYTSSVEKEMMGIDSKKDAALSTYNTKLDEIDGLRIASNTERSTLRLNALSNYNSTVTEIRRDQRDFEYRFASDNYQRGVEAVRVARDVAAAEREKAATNLTALLKLQNGKSYSELNPSLRRELDRLAQVIELPKSFVSDSLQFAIDHPDRDYQVQYMTDSSGNVTQVLFDKISGKTITNPIGRIGKGTSSSGSANTLPGATSWNLKGTNMQIGFDPKNMVLLQEIADGITDGVYDNVVDGVQALGSDVQKKFTSTADMANQYDAYINAPADVIERADAVRRGVEYTPKTEEIQAPEDQSPQSSFNPFLFNLDYIGRGLFQ